MFARLYVLHRWLGLAGGLMVVVWFSSGLLIHWRWVSGGDALPRLLTPAEQSRLLGQPFSAAEAERDFPAILAQLDRPVREARLRRAGPRLVYDVRDAGGNAWILDSRSGELLSPISEAIAREIATSLVSAATIDTVVLMSRPDAFSYNLSMPVYRVTFDDPSRTTVYVDPKTASVAARTQTRQRMYFLFGSLPHFLNFPILRRIGPSAQDWLLLTLNTLGALATAFGLAVATVITWRRGVLAVFRQKQPLWRKCHYFLGLAFSVPTLLFIGSGFFYVLDGSSPQDRIVPDPPERHRVAGLLAPDQVRIGARSASRPEERVSMVVLRQVLGVPLYLFGAADGSWNVVRADNGRPLVVDRRWIERVAAAFLQEPAPSCQSELLTQYDAYYYARSGRAPALPVHRVRCSDRSSTYLYLSPITGEVLGRATREFRMFRWFVSGFHTWDWPFLLDRPVLRHSVVVILSLGGLAMTLGGLYIGLGHVRRRLGRLAR